MTRVRLRAHPNRAPAHDLAALRCLTLALALLAIGLLGCGGARSVHRSPSADMTRGGGTHGGTTSGAHVAVVSHRAAADHDEDDAERLLSDDNNSEVTEFGHPASPADTRAISAVLRRYYATASAGNGTIACSMIVSSLAKAVPLDYGRFGPAYLRGGKTCPAMLVRLFAHEHRRLIGETASLAVRALRIHGNQGLVLLGFGKSERQISVQHEAGRWKLDGLLDGELP